MEGASVRSLTVIELSASTVWERNENTGTYEIVSEDVMPVSEQFNRLANERDVNPVGTPTISETQLVEIPGKRIVNTRVLCAVVMKRSDYEQMELSYREFMARIIASLGDGPPPQPAEQTRPPQPAEQTRKPQTAQQFTYPGVRTRTGHETQ